VKGRIIRDLMGIVADFVHVCPEGGYLFDDRLIADAYHRDNMWFLAWFIEVFVTDAAEKRRLIGALGGVDGFFQELAAYHKDTTGEPLLIPPEVVDALKRRILAGYFPGVDEIVAQAKYGPILGAQRALKQYMEASAWRMRSGS